MKHSFQLGSLHGWVLRDGARAFPAAHFFAPAALEAFGVTPAIEVDFSLNCLLLRTAAGQQILVDTGLGRDVGGNEGRLFMALKQAGTTPEAINMVVVTHGHWDHIGGLLTEDGVERFPNARLLMPKTEWAFWTDPAELAKMDGPVRDWAKDILPPLFGRLEGFTPGDELWPGARAIDLAGHTVGQCGLQIESEGETLLLAADAVHQPFQFAAPTFSPDVDYDHDQSNLSRQRLIDLALAPETQLLGYHFPFPGLGKLGQDDDGLIWEPAAAL